MYEDLTFTLLFGVGVGLCCIFAAVTYLIGRYLTLRKGRSPRCGHCGYPATGLESFTCPECGSNLQLVGIITPAMRHPVSRRWIYVLWTIFLPLTMFIVIVFLFSNVLPGVINIDQSITLSNPDSGLYDHMDLTIHTNGSNSPGSEEVSLTIPPDENGDLYNIIIRIYLQKNDHEPAATLRFNTVTGKSVFTTASGQSSTYDADNSYSIQAIMKQCFKTIGLDLQNKDLLNELSFFQYHPVIGSNLSYGITKPQRAAGLITKPVPYWTASWNKYVNYHGPPKWFLPACLIAWLMIWIIGLTYLTILTKQSSAIYNSTEKNNFR